MLTAPEIGELIKQCAAHHVVKFEAGPEGKVAFTFSGYREPLPAGAVALDQLLSPGADPWLTQTIPPAPLPPEGE